MKYHERPLNVAGDPPLSGVVHEPTTPARGLALFLNGGGPRMDYPLNLLVCRGLAVGGWRAVRFNYRYQDHPGLEPVRKEQLEDAERVLRAAGQAAEAGQRESAAQAASGNGWPLLLLGKSYGGHLGLILAARRPEVAGVVVFGISIHDASGAGFDLAHFERVPVPVLFIQGDADPSGTPPRLEEAARKVRGGAEVVLVPGGDHSFARPGDPAGGTEPLPGHREAWKAAEGWLRRRGWL